MHHIIKYLLLFTIPLNYILSQTEKDSYNFLSINQFQYWSSNNGIGGSKPGLQFNSGCLWPGGRNAFAPLLSSDGLIWAGKINGDIFTKTTIYNPGFLQGGRIFDNGLPDDAGNEKYRVFKIRKGWETMPFGEERDQLEKDYNEWPIEDGAPWLDIDGDGIFTRGIDQPEYAGDEVLWFVMNDLDSLLFPSEFQGKGLEIQTHVFACNRIGILGDVIFKKYLLINKGQSNIDSFYLGYSYVQILGDGIDNYIGCDTLLNLTFVYHSNNYDPVYNIPPVFGVQILQGPVVEGSSSDSAKFKGRWINGYKNLGLSAFNSPNLQFDTSYFSYDIFLPRKISLFNNLSGLYFYGHPIIDPVNGKFIKHIFPGDPIKETGWYREAGLPPGIIDDGLYVPTLSSGPFNFAPFDTVEVVYAISAARGTDKMNSLSELKRRAQLIQRAYDLNFQLTPLPPQPTTKAFEQEGKVTLWWDTNSEDYDEQDPFILEQEYDDTTYTFEGYRIWQYKDSLGTDPRVLAILDKENDVSVIEDYIIVNGISVKAPVIFGSNEGLRRYIHLDKDVYNNSTLYNGNPYYFGVTAYSYSKNSSPAYLESEPKIMKVIPGREKTDYTSPYKGESEQLAELVVGSGEGKVIFRVIDPTALTGDEYEVFFERVTDTLYYSLVNLTRGDTLYRRSDDLTLDTLGKKITEGFMVLIDDAELRSVDSLLPGLRPFGIKRVIETKGPGGIELSEPINVFENINSTGQWQLKASGSSAFKEQNYDIYNRIGVDDYEIRFTSNGSEYYTSGYITIGALFRDDPKTNSRIPFEIWNVTKDERLNIKIWDRTITDTIWSRNEQTGDWERVYGMKLSFPYSEPLPQSTGVTTEENYPVGNIVFSGEIPEEGTVIKIETFKPIQPGYKYRAVMEKANFTNIEAGKENIDKITVFPNPYFGGNNLERGNEERIMRFTGLPTNVTIRIYTLAGVFVKRLDKTEINQYVDWDLQNENGDLVSSGMYIAHLEMPGIGNKILKLAVVMGKEFLNRF